MQAIVATSGRPISANIIERYRRMIKQGLPSLEDRVARKGLTISEMARLTDTDRRTVRKYVLALLDQDQRRRAAPSNEQMPDGVP